MFPITSIGSVGGSVSGDLFGMEVNASFVLGIVKFNAESQIVSDTNGTVTVTQLTTNSDGSVTETPVTNSPDTAVEEFGSVCRRGGRRGNPGRGRRADLHRLFLSGAADGLFERGISADP